jgi:hypothetical protein
MLEEACCRTDQRSILYYSEFYEKHFYPLITTMSARNGPYSPRVAACCLIPVTYPHVNEQIQAEFRASFKAFALQENSPLVRRAVA